MRRKRIGLLVAQAEEKNQSAFIEGFNRSAFALDFDVCIFSMHIRLQGTIEREIGDSNIYNLFIPEMYDAIVMLPDTIQTPGVANKLIDRIRKNFNGPVLMIDRQNEYYPSVMMDHYTPVFNLINHLIEVHNYKDIIFISGFKGHEHSVQRERAYLDSMKAHGLVASKNNIYNADYWYTGGTDVVKEIIRKRHVLPEAIACGNDYMAIGAAAELERYGIRVPEDIAVIGYDSVDEGLKSPVALTSADIPARSCGEYAARWIDAALKGQTIDSFVADEPIRIGGSCGCKYEEDSFYLGRRQEWDTEVSASGYNSYYNYIMESLLSQSEHRGFYNTIFQYVNQLRPFDSFHLCVNDYYKNESFLTENDVERQEYTDRMCRIIKCGADENTGNSINFEDEFDTSELLPELNDYREKPAAFFFSPMHFDDRCYGYAVISYGDKPKCYDSTYRNWLKDIMQSMEAFYRQAALKSLLAKIEITQVRDALTGLYNFKGFLNKGLELKDKNTYEDGRMLIMVIDLIGLKDINSLHGRNMGDDALLSLTHIITNTIGHNQVCGRLSNSEFGAAIFTDDATEKAKQISELIEEAVEKFNQETEQPYKLTICIGSRSDVISGAATLEYLINEAIKDKNDKRLIRQNSLKHRDGMDIESIENDRIVTDILDHNRLKYFFQPIVSAKTGEIYSYEALMRADTDAELTPPKILESAERMERLYDVEKATFFNVLDYVEAHKNELYGRKVFINSIPGYQLKGEDKKLLEGRMLKHQGELVVEFTEETEIGDKQLVEIKDNYANLNIETAIDDYGSGYSNVNNLLRYMPKYVKIDRALMTDIHKNPQKQHFVKDIIEFAHANDILTLAEGVELSEELKEVIRLGVDLIQGYYTAKPQPYFMAKIDERVITEIVQYNQVAMSRYTKRYYEADGEARISMVKLALNKYTGLILRRPARGENKVELGGIPGFQSNLIIRVADGFEGEVVLNNISLSGDRGIPCIDIGNDCKLKLTLVGDNELLTGGIRVPETSSLTFYGEGNLSILINSGKYYAIGNDLDSRNGEIIFNQDGGIIIDANGMRGVGIGSGLGGDISIHRGHYEMEMKGQEGVCIGSVYGDTNLSIEYCDMDIYSGISNGTVLGSYTGDAEVFMENISARITGSGNTIVGIGTYAGDRCKASIRNASATFNIRATECYAMGSNSADTEVDIAYASVKVAVQGKQAYAFGNDRRDARVLFANSDVRTDVRNNSDIDIAADEANIRIENGGGEFIINGRNIEREAILTTL